MTHAISPSDAAGFRIFGRPLVTLLRGALLRRWGVRAARVFAALVAVGCSATIWVVAGGQGADGTVLSLVARASGVLAWLSGGLTALSLSVPPKDQALSRGIEALAAARGITDAPLARAGMIASIRLLLEVLVSPMVAIGLFVFTVVARGKLAGALQPVVGAVLFAVATAMILGAVCSFCRHWGKAQGRSWLATLVFLPWVLAEVILPGKSADFLSIPGILGRLWSALTAVAW